MYNLMRRAVPEFAQVLVTFVDELHTPPAELLDICIEIVQVRRVGSHVKPDRGRPDVVEEFDTPAFRAALDQTLRKWKPADRATRIYADGGVCVAMRACQDSADRARHYHRSLSATAGRSEGPRTGPHNSNAGVRSRTTAWRSMDCVVIMSEKDREIVAGARKVIALPNGVDLERFKPSSADPDPRRLLFIGSFAHLPNLLAIDFFLRKVWPLLGDKSPVLHIIAGARHRFHYDRFRDRVNFLLDTPRVEIEDFVTRCTTRLRTGRRS